MSGRLAEAWPTEAASRVKLVTPKQFKPSPQQHCILRYNHADRMVEIVDHEDGRVLDLIDVDDMIGAKMEIELTTDDDDVDRPSDNNHGSSSRAFNEPPSDRLVDRQGSAVLTIFTYPRKDPSQVSLLNSCGFATYRPKPNPNYARPLDPSKLGNRVAHPREFVVTPAEDLQDLSSLVVALQKLATGLDVSLKPPTYLILVNPRSGPKRNGAKLAETVVQPMLEESGVQSDIFITSHPKHAIERVQKGGSGEKDLLDYDGLVLMGGDGIIHEALNGIMARDDQSQVLKKLKFGVVGCGTSNGFATSITHHSKERYGPVDETYLICKGRSLPTDISRYQASSSSFFSFLTFSWAIIADIDIESERIHFLGEARYDVWAVLRVLFLRRYRGRFSYLPASKVANKSQPIANMPDLSDAVPSDWEVIEDDFLLFWASQVTHAGMHAFHSPKSSLCDGIFQVLIVRSCVSRIRLARILLGIESGSHVNMHGVEFIECTAYRLEPLTPGSVNDLDGEPVEDGPIQGYVLPAAWRVFCSP